MLGHNWNRRYHSPYKSRLFCRDGTFRFSKWTEYASWELSKASILRLANSCQVATAEVHPVYGLHFPPPEAHQTVEAPASDSDATIIDDSDATIVEERLYDSDSTVKPTMPYNVSAIAPSEEISGTTTLPRKSPLSSLLRLTNASLSCSCEEDSGGGRRHQLSVCQRGFRHYYCHRKLSLTLMRASMLTILGNVHPLSC